MDLSSLFSLCMKVLTRWEVIAATIALVIAWSVLRYIAVVAGVERPRPSRRIRRILGRKSEAPQPKKAEREEEGFRREE